MSRALYLLSTKKEQFPELTKLFDREKNNEKINRTAGSVPDNNIVQDEEENTKMT